MCALDKSLQAFVSRASRTGWCLCCGPRSGSYLGRSVCTFEAHTHTKYIHRYHKRIHQAHQNTNQAHHHLHTAVTTSQTIQRLLSNCKIQQFGILRSPWAFDFVLGEALVTLCFVETPPSMRKHEYTRHVKSVAGVFTWMRLLPPTSLA